MEPLSLTISYKSADIQPPLFIAGSYSDPPWTPQEMDHAATQAGEQIFTKTIKGSPGSTVQYKFRVGTGSWWILDKTTSTVTDDMGNENNIVKLPDASLERPPTPPPDSPSQPIFSLDTAEVGPELSHENPGRTEEDTSVAPLFAYEIAGGNDHPPSDRANSHVSSISDETRDDDFDPNDPTLERFPSNREEIIEKVRTIETGLDEDRAPFGGAPLSPVVSPGRRQSAEINGDVLTVLSGSDAGVGRSEVRLEPHRLSRSRDSQRPSISGGSLHCIVEESAVEEAVEDEEHEEAVAEVPAPAPTVETPVEAPTPVEALVATEAPAAEPAAPDVQDAQVAPASPEVVTVQHVNWFTAFFKHVFVDWMGSLFGRLFHWRR